MSKPDRLSALISRFDLRADIVNDLSAANLFLFGCVESGEIRRIEFWPLKSEVVHSTRDELIVAASIDMGGEANPLVQALPKKIVLAVDQARSIQDLSQLILSEIVEARCGRATTIRRLFEVLVVILLRHAIRSDIEKTGLIAGLADDRICKAIVAIHERPEFEWHIEDLADIAGLSRSQFMECFKTCVGQNPAQYLREWRLALVRKDLERGERVKTVASRYGYKSQEAISRAFSKHFHCTPSQYRLQAR